LSFSRSSKNATRGFRTTLLEQLTAEQAEVLLNKTIAAGRSIGTLDLAMRALREDDPKLLGRLEQSIGAAGFLRLILTNGALSELFQVLQRATRGFRTTLLEQLSTEQAGSLIDKTIEGARRIENLHFALRSLRENSDQLSRLEDVIGVAGWWRLLIACGSLNSVSQITQAMSSRFSAKVITAAAELSMLDWGGIIARGLFLNACDFAKNDLRAYSEWGGAPFAQLLWRPPLPWRHKRAGLT